MKKQELFLKLIKNNNPQRILEFLNDKDFNPSFDDNKALHLLITNNYTYLSFLLPLFLDNIENFIFTDKSIHKKEKQIQMIEFIIKNIDVDDGRVTLLLSSIFRETRYRHIIKNLINNKTSQLIFNVSFLNVLCDHKYEEEANLLIDSNEVDLSSSLQNPIAHAALAGFDSIVLKLLYHPNFDSLFNLHLNLKSIAGYCRLNTFKAAYEHYIQEDNEENNLILNNCLIESSLNDNVDNTSFLLNHTNADPTFQNYDCFLKALQFHCFETLELLISDSRVDPTLNESSILYVACLEPKEPKKDFIFKVFDHPLIDPHFSNNAIFLISAYHKRMEVLEIILEHSSFQKYNLDINELYKFKDEELGILFYLYKKSNFRTSIQNLLKDAEEFNLLDKIHAKYSSELF